MAEDAPKTKSGRTPEQQAARDARKAAKKAAEAEKAAAAEATGETETEGASSSRKRAAEDDAEAGDLLEIDMGANAPLSKAELRAARKRAKRGDEPLPPKQTDNGETKKSKATEGAEAKEKVQPKGEFSVWVGNMSFRTTEDSLKQFMERGIVDSGGPAGAITRVYLPKKAGRGGFSENKGFAYVDFQTDAVRLLALGLSERPLEGRRLLIKAGDDHKANPEARTPKPLPSGPGTVPGVLAKQKHGESSTLFIGNLPFDCTEEELRDLVETNTQEVFVPPKEDDEDGEGEGKEGEDEEGEEKPAHATSSRAGIKSGLLKTRVGQFEDTGRCKGFAFWDFKDPAHAKAALLNRKNHYLRGRRLVLQFASESATKRAGGRKGDGDKPRGAGGPGGARGAPRPRPARYFESAGGEDGEGEGHSQAHGGDDEGGYEAHSRGPTGPTDYKSEAAAAARIAAMVSGGGGGGDDSRGGYGGKPEKVDKRGKKWESTGRPRPGAALAMAQREKVGIVESAGTKVTFD